ncbi:hypothetical protein LCL97_00755 [Seohaeicola saemankumensis]|nr:hypothetical protein [Seohaeicola saemankumensis]MCA0869340.1 hypothetical protein [Seohaeicola saemankumensis]
MAEIKPILSWAGPAAIPRRPVKALREMEKTGRWALGTPTCPIREGVRNRWSAGRAGKPNLPAWLTLPECGTFAKGAMSKARPWAAFCLFWDCACEIMPINP